MNKVVNFNKAASELMTGMTKIRLRTVDGVIEIRPTNRVNGRDLVDLRNKSQAIPGKRVSLSAETLGDLRFFKVEPIKHGWLRLNPCEQQINVPGKPQAAGGSVSER
jgi:hypothetical protein